MMIRKATIDDTEALRPLYYGSLRRMVSLQPDHFQIISQSTEFIQKGILSEDADILVAEENGEILGLASVFVAEVEDKTINVPHKYCDLDTLFVAEPHRGKGVGSALLEAAWSWAQAHGLSSMELMMLGGNEIARKFYEKHGMKAYKMFYIKK